MNKFSLISIGLVMVSTTAVAQWAQPWGGSNMMPSMPYGGGYSQPRYAPQPQQPFNMMPFGQQRAPAYRPAPAQPFGGMMPFPTQPQPQYQPAPQSPFGGMMPWGSQPQPRYQAPAQQPFMMPGMDQGIRSMMQPGKIMAEEATPGMYMKPTWR